MHAIRILLAAPPNWLPATIRTAITADPELVVVGEASGEVDILLQAADADVVILGETGYSPPPVAERLLDEYPRIAVVMIDTGGAHGLLYRLRPEHTRISLVDPAELVEAIRRAVADLPV